VFVEETLSQDGHTGEAKIHKITFRDALNSFTDRLSELTETFFLKINFGR